MKARRLCYMQQRSGGWQALCSGWKLCSSCSALLSGRSQQSWVRMPMLRVAIPVVPDQAAANAGPLLLQTGAAVWSVAAAAWSD